MNIKSIPLALALGFQSGASALTAGYFLGRNVSYLAPLATNLTATFVTASLPLALFTLTFMNLSIPDFPKASLGLKVTTFVGTIAALQFSPFVLPIELAITTIGLGILGSAGVGMVIMFSLE